MLSEDERLVRDTARRFIEDNLIPIIEECNREGRFPRELVKPMGEMGFFGANLHGYGCAGMSNVEYGLVTQEMERGDSGIRSFVSVQSALVMYPIYTFGSDEQKDEWLPAMAKGEKLGCFGLTEPDFGSNPGGMRTRAQARRHRLHPERRKDVDHLRLHRRCRGDLGQGRGRGRPRARISGADQDAGLPRLRCARQMVAARLRHLRAVAAGRAAARLGSAARFGRPEVAADVPEPGALWHRLGRDRRGHVLLRHGAAILADAQAVPRPAHRQPSDWCRRSWPG